MEVQQKIQQYNQASKKGLSQRVCRSLSLLLISVFLIACSQSSNPENGTISGDKLNAPIPKALSDELLTETNLIVDVIIDGNTDNPTRVENLVVDASNGTYTGNIPEFPAGPHTIILVYSINDPLQGIVEIIKTSDITVDVVVNEETPADISNTELTYTDTDGDTFNNLYELTIGTDVRVKHFRLSGQIENLSGSDFILQNNGEENLTVTPMDAETNNFTVNFTFNNLTAIGSNYSVTILSQPSSPEQNCIVTNGTGTINSNTASNVSIICTSQTYSIGGSISGLTGTNSGLVLQNINDSDSNPELLGVDSNGNFTFNSRVEDGRNYNVTVATQPNSPPQICSVTNGNKTVGGEDIGDVSVICASNAFSVSGNVSGLSGSGLVLQNNSGDNLGIVSNGNFTFNSQVANGGGYSITVETSPSTLSQNCTVTNGNGTISGTVISNVMVACEVSKFTVGGTITGYLSNGLSLQNNNGDTLSVSGNGRFTFSTPLFDGSSYSVAVLSQPVNPAQLCVVSNGAEWLAGTEISSVSINCNSVPTASNVTITAKNGGSVAVGDNLIGGYSYSDVESDLQGTNIFRWLRNGIAIIGATFDNYTLVAGDSGETITFEVTPVALTGAAKGLPTTSAGLLIGNSAPTASEVIIIDNNGGSAVVGDTLNGDYKYADADNDTKGTSTYQWLRDGTAITAATSATYILVTSDSGKIITFEVTPVATSGTKEGSPVTSVGISVTNSAPVFTSSAGINAAENSLITGYTAAATDPDGETVTYSLTGGEDLGSFEIEATSGILTFSASPDFEQQADSDGNNDYIVEITATDGLNPVTKMVTISVTDILDITATTTGIKTIQFRWSDYAGAISYKLLVNPDGASGFTVLEDNITTPYSTIEMSVHLTDWVNASYMLEAYNGTGKIATSAPIDITSMMISNIGYIKPKFPSYEGQFGITTSLSGDGKTLVVGSPYEQSSAVGINGPGEGGYWTRFSGAAYIFQRIADRWQQVAFVKASNPAEEANFGISVSLSADGDSLAVGASGAGLVYIFNRDVSGTWSQVNILVASGPFGSIVELSGDGRTLAVSTGQNAHILYLADNGVWSEQAILYGAFDDSYLYNGFIFTGLNFSLSGDGNTLALGAYRDDSSEKGIRVGGGGAANNLALSSGAVFIYTRSGTTWSQQAYIKASNTNAGDRFGIAVSLSSNGKILAVGADYEMSNASGQLDNSLTNAGAVYVFEYPSFGGWTQQAYLKASNTQEDARFGNAVSLSPDGYTLAIGSLGESSAAVGVDGDQTDTSNTNAGAVYLYSRSAFGGWSPKAYLKASNTDRFDRFGASVKLNSNGKTLAVGASFEKGGTGGVGQTQDDNSESLAGAVYLY